MDPLVTRLNEAEATRFADVLKKHGMLKGREFNQITDDDLFISLAEYPIEAFLNDLPDDLAGRLNYHLHRRFKALRPCHHPTVVNAYTFVHTEIFPDIWSSLGQMPSRYRIFTEAMQRPLTLGSIDLSKEALSIYRKFLAVAILDQENVGAIFELFKWTLQVVWEDELNAGDFTPLNSLTNHTEFSLVEQFMFPSSFPHSTHTKLLSHCIACLIKTPSLRHQMVDLIVRSDSFIPEYLLLIAADASLIKDHYPIDKAFRMVAEMGGISNSCQTRKLELTNSRTELRKLEQETNEPLRTLKSKLNSKQSEIKAAKIIRAQFLQAGQPDYLVPDQLKTNDFLADAKVMVQEFFIKRNRQPQLPSHRHVFLVAATAMDDKLESLQMQFERLDFEESVLRFDLNQKTRALNEKIRNGGRSEDLNTALLNLSEKISKKLQPKLADERQRLERLINSHRAPNPIHFWNLFVSDPKSSRAQLNIQRDMQEFLDTCPEFMRLELLKDQLNPLTALIVIAWSADTGDLKTLQYARDYFTNFCAEVKRHQMGTPLQLNVLAQILTFVNELKDDLFDKHKGIVRSVYAKLANQHLTPNLEQMCQTHGLDSLAFLRFLAPALFVQCAQKVFYDLGVEKGITILGEIFERKDDLLIPVFITSLSQHLHQAIPSYHQRQYVREIFAYVTRKYPSEKPSVEAVKLYIDLISLLTLGGEGQSFILQSVTPEVAVQLLRDPHQKNIWRGTLWRGTLTKCASTYSGTDITDMQTIVEGLQTYSKESDFTTAQITSAQKLCVTYFDHQLRTEHDKVLAYQKALAHPLLTMNDVCELVKRYMTLAVALRIVAEERWDTHNEVMREALRYLSEQPFEAISENIIGLLKQNAEKLPLPFAKQTRDYAGRILVRCFKSVSAAKTFVETAGQVKRLSPAVFTEELAARLNSDIILKVLTRGLNESEVTFIDAAIKYMATHYEKNATLNEQLIPTFLTNWVAKAAEKNLGLNEDGLRRLAEKAAQAQIKTLHHEFSAIKQSYSLDAFIDYKKAIPGSRSIVEESIARTNALREWSKHLPSDSPSHFKNHLGECLNPVSAIVVLDKALKTHDDVLIMISVGALSELLKGTHSMARAELAKCVFDFFKSMVLVRLKNVAARPPVFAMIDKLILRCLELNFDNFKTGTDVKGVSPANHFIETIKWIKQVSMPFYDKVIWHHLSPHVVREIAAVAFLTKDKHLLLLAVDYLTSPRFWTDWGNKEFRRNPKVMTHAVWYSLYSDVRKKLLVPNIGDHNDCLKELIKQVELAKQASGKELCDAADATAKELHLDASPFWNRMSWGEKKKELNINPYLLRELIQQLVLRTVATQTTPLDGLVDKIVNAARLLHDQW